MVPPRKLDVSHVPSQEPSLLPGSCPDGGLTSDWSAYFTAVFEVIRLTLNENFINWSLAALADVLVALSEHYDYIPHLNSKLTNLLKESIDLSTSETPK